MDRQSDSYLYLPDAVGGGGGGGGAAVGKGEIAHHEQFLLFPHCFQKTYTADTEKPGQVWERVKHYHLIESTYLMVYCLEDKQPCSIKKEA